MTTSWQRVILGMFKRFPETEGSLTAMLQTSPDAAVQPRKKESLGKAAGRIEATSMARAGSCARTAAALKSPEVKGPAAASAPVMASSSLLLGLGFLPI